MHALLSRQQIDKLVHLFAEERPAALDVLHQRVRLILVITPMRRIPELMQLDNAKSIIRNLPPK